MKPYMTGPTATWRSRRSWSPKSSPLSDRILISISWDTGSQRGYRDKLFINCFNETFLIQFWHTYVMTQRSPEEAVKNSLHDIDLEYLSETGSDIVFDDPIISYLRPDEEMKYLFRHPYKGLRIIRPDGTEETPDHRMATSGSRLLTVTDQRVLYFAGKEDGDQVRTWHYDELEAVEASRGWTHGRLNLTTDDGTEFKFADAGGRAGVIEAAGEYVAEQLLEDEDVASGSSRRTAEQRSEYTATAEPPQSDEASDTRVFEPSGSPRDDEARSESEAQTREGSFKFGADSVSDTVRFRCPQCREPNRDDGSFCSYCGQRVLICDDCGEAHQPEVNYCSNCGFDLE